ncbi:hypothetical protein [Candidatus Erwinia dacicola]|nr:hypothetical protein [Candidatus Erwinia dacicola]NJC99938.1 hypothetical protein [Candidatus Erwinia dacicola]NJD85435.1 hypothetical protein [Candidatus Erwinia dacicola]
MVGRSQKRRFNLLTMNDRNVVRADTIVRVYVQSDYLMVQTIDGEIYQADGGYGQTVWRAKSALLDQIEAALAVGNQG